MSSLCWDCGERKGIIPAVDDHRSEPLDVTFVDIERCPYVASDPEYADWIACDDARIRRQVLARRPADKTGIVHSICVRCTNRWRPFMAKKADPAANSEE